MVPRHGFLNAVSKKWNLNFKKKSIAGNNASLPVPKKRWDDKGLKEVLLSNHGINGLL